MPAAEVIPVVGGFHDRDVVGVFHDGIVDRDAVDGGEFGFKHFVLPVGAPGGDDVLQVREHRRLALGEGVENRLGAPEEYAGIPIKIA